MARPRQEEKTKTKEKTVARPPRAKTTAQKLEELKLGKFTEREVLRLPAKEVRRGWQIVGAVALMLGAIVGVFAVFMLEPLRGLTWDQTGFSPFGGLEIYEGVMVLCIALAALICAVASMMLFAGKRVPVFLWYVLVVTATLGLLCASFHTFKWFEARKCYENYPGIYPNDPNKGSGCPSVEYDLIGISIRNLLIYTAGLVAFLLVRRMARGRTGRKCY